MTNTNFSHNQCVWFDIPVSDLNRANTFYSAILDRQAMVQELPGVRFSVLEQHGGNSGCLVVSPAEITGSAGILIYLNVDGRLHDAVARTLKHGGKILKPIHTIGPHGFRAIILDSEGNRLALHSRTNA